MDIQDPWASILQKSRQASDNQPATTVAQGTLQAELCQQQQTGENTATPHLNSQMHLSHASQDTIQFLNLDFTQFKQYQT